MQSKQLITWSLVTITSFFGVGYFLSNVSFQSQVVPVWLPAGIALAACFLSKNKLLPAVFIASFIFNFSVGPAFSLDTLMSVVALQNAIIASGATLQAFVGASILIYWLGDPLAQESNRKTLTFVFGVGVLINLISANIGVSSLTALNPVFSWEGYWFNMLYWWLGDSAGVLIATPLILAAYRFNQASKEQQGQYIVITGAMSALFISVVLLTWLFVNKSNQSIQGQIDNHVTTIDNSLYRKISGNLSELKTLAETLGQQRQFSLAQFNQITDPYLQQNRSIKALSYNPIIDPTDLANHNEELRVVYPDGHLIRGESLNQDDAIIYVKYINPLAKNDQAVGFNLNSSVTRRETLSRVVLSHQPAATAVLDLVQSNEKAPAILIFHPVLVSEGDNKWRANKNLIGLATGVFLVEGIINSILTAEQQRLFDYQIFEAGSKTPFLQSGGSKMRTESDIEIDIQVLNKTWIMKLHVNDSYLLQRKNESFLVLFLLQFAIVSIFTSLILLMNNRRVGLDKMVKIRTRSLEKAVAEANRANAAKSRFLANMSHEIRTPMNSVVGFSRLAAQTNSLDEMKGYIDQIAISSDLMMGIINDILDISKIESNSLQLNKERFDLKHLIADINTIFKSQCSEQKLEWVFVDELPVNSEFMGDPIRIQQVLGNLCSNAIKFTHKGKVMMHAGEVSRENEAAIIKFSIRDSGIGLSAEQIERIFEPFTQADETTSREFGGTGLGLAITKQLCDLMNGSITVQSELGRGSLFIVELPLQVVSPASEGVAQVTDKWKERDTSLNHLNVLVAEDNKINQMLIVKILNRFGINPKVVDNGQQAVEICLKTPFDVVLMDCQMPVMDGYEATKQIKRENPQQVIYALTADVDDDSRKKAVAYGFDLHISKPIDADRLHGYLKALSDS